MAISRSASLSLDLLRASAASAVVLYHASWFQLDDGLFGFFTPRLGHSAVIVFFVLSGFVIAATTRPDHSALEYAIKRISRVYSVALPAVLIVIALNYFSLWRGITPPDAYELRQPVAYFGLHMLFGGDLWSLAIGAFSIGPYWSLNYEVWYYVVFGAAVFTPGVLRYFAVAIVLLMAGPKIVVLLPVWLAGAAVYKLSQRHLLPRGWARLVAVVSVIVLIGFTDSAWDKASDVASFSLAAHLPFSLRFSQWFLGDYVRCVATCGLIWSFCSAEIPWPATLARWGKRLAEVSFSLYLMHAPLMAFFRNLDPAAGPLAAVLAVACSIGFGLVFEPQRDRVRRVLHGLTRIRVPHRT